MQIVKEAREPMLTKCKFKTVLLKDKKDIDVETIVNEELNKLYVNDKVIIITKIEVFENKIILIIIYR